jgi:hypothetical protein
LLHLVNDRVDVSEFTFACGPEAETLADILNGFALCFPAFRIDTVCNQLGEAVDNDEIVRVTDVFVHKVIGDEGQPIPQIPVIPTAFPRAQFQVANGLYSIVCEQLKSDGRCVGDHKSLRCVVLVPKFNSLKQQTEERIQACEGLARADQSFEVNVELYPTPSSQQRMQILLQEIRSKKHPDKLYVFVVDECHYGPTVNATPALHHADVRGMNNVVVVMVSATPFNCVSTQSRIPLRNIIEWTSLVDPHATPSYIGFEHYFRSVAFTLPGPDDAVAAGSAELSRLVVVVDNSTVAVPLDHYREYADDVAVTAMISRCLNASKVPLTCSNLKSGAVVFRRDGNRKTQLFINDTPLLRSLGFSAGVCIPAGAKEAVAQDEHTLGDDVSLVSQHLRQDSHFSSLRKEIVAKCHKLKRFNAGNAVKLSAEWSDDWKGLQGHCPPQKVLLNRMMSAKNGFAIILDYILSIAYYGSCRVEPNAGDATFRLMPLHVVEADDGMCARFLDMVTECCYFDDDRSGQACNICDALNAALEHLYCNAHEEMKAFGAVDYAACLRFILSEKLQAEGSQHTTSHDQSWFTETDRIVRMLVAERSPAPMVLMRVFDTDENMAMQIVLRHALQVCGLVISRPGNRSVPAFSVISDTSETSLLTQIEDHYRYDYNVGEGSDVIHVQDIVAKRERAASEAAVAAGKVRKANPDLKYEDLLNVPCLIILCEKGRMGDTFPHTLRTLDLRLRTGGTASCFLQEIGRMCRYPRTQDPEVVLDVQQVMDYCAEASHGVIVSAANTQQFLGVARTAADVERVVRAACPVAQLPVLLAQIVHPLPCALIDPKVMKAIRMAVNQREAHLALATAAAADGAPVTQSVMTERRRINKVIRCLKMPNGVDSYLSSTMMCAPLEYELVPSKDHYDISNVQLQRHHRRFLLSAECQVGKTGAYLHFLSLLRSAITGLPGDGQPPPVPPVAPLGAPWHRWLIPRLDDLTQQPDMLYDFPKTGKYHRCIAHQRLALLLSLIATQLDGGNFSQRFVTLVQQHECTVAERGKQRLAALPQYDTVPPEGCVGNNWILDFVNWDGRLVRDGKWHTCRDELLLAFEQWQGGEVVVPLAQSVMFGEHPAVSLLEAELEGLEGHLDLSAPRTAAVVPVPLAGNLDVDYRAKTVAEYQLTIRLLPADDSVTIELDDFFSMSSTRHGDYHRPTGSSGTKLSIPAAARTIAAAGLAQFSRASCLPVKLGSLLKAPGKIRHWVFTPTFSGTTAGPQDKLLMRDDAYALPSGPLKRWEDYGEVLLVRACQLQDYQRFYGGTHIIAAMPDSMQYVDAKGLPGPVLYAADHGCGYSRRFGQLLASYLGLQRVWMVDDYVLKCWQIVCADRFSVRGNVQVQPTTFAAVMMHIEALFNPESRSPYPHFEDRAAEAMRSEGKDETAPLSEIVGSAEKYGVVGMWRGYQWRDDVAHPVKKSYSVYSFFLLNVEATVGNRLYFPARPIWEDIEFNNLLDEHGLLVCKLQVFAHEKKVHSPAIELFQPLVEAPTLYTWLRDEGYLLCGSAPYYESIMTVPKVNTVLRELEGSLPPEPPQESVTFLTAAHNVSVFQDGALAGLEHECTLQSCVHRIFYESAVLVHAIQRAETTKQPVRWLLLVPAVGTITHTDAALVTLDLHRSDLSMSFQLLPYNAAEPIIIILATLSQSSAAAAAAATQLSTAPTARGVVFSPPQLGHSSVSPAPSVASRTLRLQAKKSPRRKVVEKAVDKVDEWLNRNASKLIGQFKSGGKLLGNKKTDAINDIFGRELPSVSELGEQLTPAELYNRCNKKCIRQADAAKKRMRRALRASEAVTQAGDGINASHHSVATRGGATHGEEAGPGWTTEWNDAAMEGEDGTPDESAFSEEEGDQGEGEEEDGANPATPAKRPRRM